MGVVMEVVSGSGHGGCLGGVVMEDGDSVWVYW